LLGLKVIGLVDFIALNFQALFTFEGLLVCELEHEEVPIFTSGEFHKNYHGFVESLEIVFRVKVIL
jgi:hypothetical protein